MIDTAAPVFERHQNPVLKDVDPYIPGPTSASISKKYGIAPDVLTKLSSNEAPLGPAPEIRAAIERIAQSDELHRYPSPSMVDLRTAIAQRLGLTAANIALGCGSSETWGMIVRAFSAPGDEVLAVEPSMTSYWECAILNERVARKATVDAPFVVTADAILAAVTPNTRIIFLSSPNNTTSRLVPLDVICAISVGAPDAVVVVDEHYVDAAVDSTSVSAISLLGECSNVLVAQTFSKMFGMAGVRLGYAAGPADAIATVASFKPKWNVSVLAEHAGLAALQAMDHFHSNVTMTIEGREQLLTGLAKLDVEIVPEAQGGFVLFRPTKKAGDDVTESLFSKGMMVRGDLAPGYIRVSVGTPEQNARFLDVLVGLL